MKFTTTAVLFAAGAYAAATGTGSAEATGTPAVTAAPAPTYTPSPGQLCISKNCKAGDVNCAASCVGVPYPNTAQIEDTHSCAANCKQSASTYAACLDSCINSHYYNPTKAVGGGSGGGDANPTGTDAGSEATGTGSGSGAQATGTDATGTGSVNATASATGNSANQVGMSFAGVIGAALFALVL